YFSTEAGAGGASMIRYIRWTIASVAAGANGTLTFKATVKYPTAAGTTVTNVASNDQYCSQPSGNPDRYCYAAGSATAGTSINATMLASTSTMTDSSFQLKEDL